LTARFVAADAAAIVLFTTVGLLSHGFELVGYARDALPLLACWFAVALVVGLYRSPSWTRFAVCWAVALPLGWLLRALVLGRRIDGGELSFLGVTLGAGLLFLVTLRLLAHAAGRSGDAS
jgi:hypothetical protein